MLIIFYYLLFSIKVFIEKKMLGLNKSFLNAKNYATFI